MTDSAGSTGSAPPGTNGLARGLSGDSDPDGFSGGPGDPPGGNGDVDDDEVEPVELLVQLAEEGEIDPWDVDLVEATDAFLDRLDETDLRTSGRALFYAAVLLRMKSDALLESDDEEDDELEPWEEALERGGSAPIAGGDDGAAGPGFDPVDALEAEMDRRLERKQARGSPETLDELVRELREAERESWWKRRREYDTSSTSRSDRGGTQTLDYRSADEFRGADEPTAADVTETAHSEDIETSIESVRAAVTVHYDNGREEVLFAEIDDAAATPVTTYLALLFLSHRGELHLQQDDLFGDLWIRDPDTVEAAVADDDAAANTEAPVPAADDD
ncbi:segregation/condensation protein A [Halobellus clavatus]|uniref:Condensin subunit ScpA n=1 Tax=Halobellus clavatus TaxID=660517 RepID=A0A1H3D541_9EURY|nr:segregation/condensation protein A [Halobellus clavatus]SDX60799.1 condensin subunit ScpA [Halobellus clavatus]